MRVHTATLVAVRASGPMMSDADHRAAYRRHAAHLLASAAEKAPPECAPVS
ncbi:hypothetical protein [Cryptosporangium aurantiacum]|uniref:hypothetical protein n=1 Tax=Cryptosporangium aurantiacum TaxID=134849 RepID=UPI0015BE1498|nr:hypothetical protein [Cryptosporangium aurantiacum]